MSGVRPGRLKVYLGAAPGVGKTYRMLDEGRRRASRGADVVVGFVECHPDGGLTMVVSLPFAAHAVGAGPAERSAGGA